MLALGVNQHCAAAAVGAGASTLRRWRRRKKRCEPLAKRRGPGPGRPASPKLAAQAEAHIRATRGLVGADSLRHTVPGLSRREASRIKERTLTEMERERRAGARRVTVAAPGLLRGFDAMHVATHDGPRHLLVCADACVPFRTTAQAVEHYDARAVSAILRADIERWGAPLVYRLDRASCHREARVRRLLADHHVLVLHGPAHYPCYYGQLERQNREHRAWLRGAGVVCADDLADEIGAMMTSVNELWRRPSLDWKTANECWQPQVVSDSERTALCDDVQTRALRIAHHGVSVDLAQRLAIEQVLEQRGQLRIERGEGAR
jgi:hypothetical protein